nr:MAG TPA: hypothetical protein [Caudoviricetes sp.]
MRYLVEPTPATELKEGDTDHIRLKALVWKDAR